MHSTPPLVRGPKRWLLVAALPFLLRISPITNLYSVHAYRGVALILHGRTVVPTISV